MAKVRAYFKHVRANKVTAALACLATPNRGARAAIERIRSIQIKELRLQDNNETSARVWVDWTGVTRDGIQERWRGLVPLRWDGADWKIETFKYLEQTGGASQAQPAATRGQEAARVGRHAPAAGQPD